MTLVVIDEAHEVAGDDREDQRRQDAREEEARPDSNGSSHAMTRWNPKSDQLVMYATRADSDAPPL